MRASKIVLALAVVHLAVSAVPIAGHHEEASAHGEAAMPPMGPPEELKQIEPMIGEYSVRFFYKMDPMGDEWTETAATAVISMVAGGGAQQLAYEGEMMGMPFTGVGLTSYDRETQKWQTSWVDSMGARISIYTGGFEDGKMVVTGTDIAQGMEYKARMTTYDVTDEGFEWKYEMSLDGANYMETAKATYTKRR